LDLAVLPLAEAFRADERGERATELEMLFGPGLSGLAGGQGVAIEERGEPRLLSRARSASAAAESARE